jgi:septal ring factor EnvC (AmiA/AmiB activator)
MPASELEAQREQFHRELMRKSMRIAELELQLNALEARYERSLSWRLTKPLRVAQRLRARARAPKPG